VIPRRCGNCHKEIIPMRHKNQVFCSSATCQQARKNKWQRLKLAIDKDYKVAQIEAQKLWREKNKDYWKQYRAGNMDYTERNRERARLRKSRGVSHQPPILSPPPAQISPPTQEFAKMDATPSYPIDIKGISCPCPFVQAQVCKDGRESIILHCNINELPHRHDGLQI
jgi:hypothetical protein